MRLLVRHGINGKEELAIQVAVNAPVGWDIMKQLAWRLDLESPFQIILYLNSTAAILSPVRAISSHMTSTDLEICYLVQNLQVPTAEHYQSLVTALYEKDVVELCHLLGQGLDLTWLTPDGGHTSTLLALAIFRDNDTDAYAYQASRDLRFPRPGVSLTHLLLQALADPNILPPKQQSTTMLELAVELGSSHLVQLLLDAGATVNPEVSVVPPLMIAVLHRASRKCPIAARCSSRPVASCAYSFLCVTTPGIGSDSCHDVNLSMSCKYPLLRAQWIQCLIYFPKAKIL